MSAQILWQQLAAQRLVQGLMPDNAPVPWYLVVLQALAAWIAGGFMLGFLGSLVLFLPLPEIDGFIISALICFGMAAFIVFQQKSHASGLFVSQLGFCFATASLSGLAIGLSERLHLSSADVYLLLLFLGLLHWLTLPLFSIRFCSALVMLAAMSLWLLEQGLGVAISPLLMLSSFWLWFREPHFGRGRDLLRPLAFACAMLLPWIQEPVLKSASSLFHQHQWSLLSFWPVMLDLLILVASLSFFCHWRPATYKQRLITLILLILFVGWLIWIRGLIAAFSIIVLGFATAEWLLIVVGVVSMLGFGSWFYYSLEYTLFTKSWLLLGLGLTLLLTLWFVKHQTQSSHDAGEATHE
ncbi:DUF4401 domain-containing protein [Shewanella sp. A32]|uniref:DUF4401 domain-containing protein n=1 Tax=Shewanella sp. A32 TaxID=3031327 RepID=UPI0023B8B421|nr:DUF4401 domain-containing protein [Shewanella sp. A32]MDF0533534.1 DUF4401 domain-containing protein [Shewanella sp. A32]